MAVDIRWLYAALGLLLLAAAAYAVYRTDTAAPHHDTEDNR